MGLSDHEQRALAEIERQLAADDPRFAARLARARSAVRVPKPVRSAVVLLAAYSLGLVTIIAGVTLASPALITLGAVITAALPVRVAVRAWRQQPPAAMPPRVRA
ncbi:DUF3040 domain-containing protein [Saccharothrix syringae]|uniref:DUF3040 domain-containing protein n=1 Tax=Saccharothrix syringae TaxID=103733 RepID=A0A5Q0H4I6_SACSY|nr:DUF3040 domain-containing protein [Saccharothrix syringae]QFZ21141.1 DUF3040 domain-containing protein [Saccharothrix syringae]